MAKNTNISLQNQVIYSIYVRNHTPEGTFAAVEPDLDRIKALGCDIIWLLPIHPIGEKAKKGSLGCPYANKDYRTVNPAYGTMEDFRHLVEQIHARGMKCIIDVVYNHTSPDSNLVKEHPEFFYRREDGSFGNKVGDWTDIIDLDYNNRQLWDYQIESLVMWAKIVDGFRCDVASFVPVEFWLKARQAVEEVNPGCIWLAESVHSGFGWWARANGIYSARDTELYEAFDIEYEYDIREVFEKYLQGDATLSNYTDVLNFQEYVYPQNYNKMRYLENHDTKRFVQYVSDDKRLENYTAMLYFLKGTTQIYAGQEYVNDFTPSLFEKDVINRKTGKDISEYLTKLSCIKQEKLGVEDYFQAKAFDEADVMVATRIGDGCRKTGVFSLKAKAAEVPVEITDGVYLNEIDGSQVKVNDGIIRCSGAPMIIVSE